MKVIIFGTGQIYQNYKQWIPKEEILFFIDNDIKKQGQYLDDILVTSPEDILNAEYDRIILMSAKAHEMKEQMIDIGVSMEKIWTYQQYIGRLFDGVLKIAHCGNSEFANKKRILIITTKLNYNGGTLAVLRAAQVLFDKGYAVVVCAPEGNAKLIEEISYKGYSVVLCPSLCYIGDTETYWMKQFDVVIVNVFQMLQCACELSKLKPVMWWVHEPENLYDIRYSYEEYDNIESMKNVRVYAVSKKAKENFEKYYPNKVSDILPLGIPDEYIDEPQENGSKEKIVFAIVGNISEIKGQIFIAQAAARFTEEERSNMEFWIIGKVNEKSVYYKELKHICCLIPQVKFLGELTREEMRIKYREIDVVICASLEETLSMAIIEGMMHKKICITTSNTGIAEYIEDGVNGFICNAGDANQLYERMSWIVKNYDKLGDMRILARNTYKEHFCMDRFGEKLEKEMLLTEALFKHSKMISGEK